MCGQTYRKAENNPSEERSRNLVRRERKGCVTSIKLLYCLFDLLFEVSLLELNFLHFKWLIGCKVTYKSRIKYRHATSLFEILGGYSILNTMLIVLSA